MHVIYSKILQESEHGAMYMLVGLSYSPGQGAFSGPDWESTLASKPQHLLRKTTFLTVPTKLPHLSSELSSTPGVLLVSSKKVPDGFSLAEVGLII